MLRVVAYREVWIVKNGSARRVNKPFYESIGPGAGLEKLGKLRREVRNQRNMI